MSLRWIIQERTVPEEEIWGTLLLANFEHETDARKVLNVLDSVLPQDLRMVQQDMRTGAMVQVLHNKSLKKAA